jgi:emfourin
LPRLTLKRSGGFAGIEDEPVRVEADRLAPALRERLPALLAAPPPEVAGADLPRYELTVEDGDERRTVAWHDDGSDAVADLRALADEVRRAAG